MNKNETAAEFIRVEKIVPSKTNPRKHFDPEKMKELVESVKRHGILQPLLVRPMFQEEPTEKSIPDHYEIVAGERRYRAAVDAVLAEIPCVIKNLKAVEALEIQVIENLQRSDLHPLEEAEGYEALMKKHGYKTADDIAAKIGKSRSYVYGRLKLCELLPPQRKAFYEEKINPSVALLLARIPASLQDKAAKIVIGGKYGEGPMPYREALRYLHDNFTLSLHGAPFDIKDPMLVPGADPCTICKKRTGNEKDLFPDIKSADVCTDPNCFKAKKQAAWRIATADAAAKGHEVLPASKKLFSDYGGYLNSVHYVRLSDNCQDDPKNRTYNQLLKDLPAAEVLLAQDHRGKACKLLKRSRADELLREAGHKFMEKKAPTQREKTPDERAVESRKEKANELATDKAVGQMVKAIEDGKKALFVFRMAVGMYMHISHNNDSLFDRRKLNKRDFVKKLGLMSLEELIGVLFELSFHDYSDSFMGGDVEKKFEEVMKQFGINFDLLVKQSLSEIESREEAETKKLAKKDKKNTTVKTKQ